jgi:hypothetical protein
VVHLRVFRGTSKEFDELMNSPSSSRLGRWSRLLSVHVQSVVVRAAVHVRLAATLGFSVGFSIYYLSFF